MSEINDKYNQLGGVSSFLGKAIAPEKDTVDGEGRYRIARLVAGARICDNFGHVDRRCLPVG